MNLDEQTAAFGGALSMREVYALGPKPWLTRRFVETDGSRNRLKRWAAAGCPSGPFDLNVVAIGSAFYDLAGRVARRLPPPVAWYASSNLLIVGLNAKHGGFFAHMPQMATVVDPAAEGLQVVGVSDMASASEHDALLAHEIAHGWSSVVCEQSTVIVSSLRAQVASHLATLDEADPLIAAAARREELAHILAAEWGFVGINANVARLRRRSSTGYVMEGYRS